MKLVLAVMLLTLCGATADAAVKEGSANYLLLYPSSTIETDFGGRCVKVTNVGASVLYLPTRSVGGWFDSLKALKTEVKVSECAAR